LNYLFFAQSKASSVKREVFSEGDGTRDGTFSVKREMLNNKPILEEKRAR
jgi:hypothetical protein